MEAKDAIRKCESTFEDCVVVDIKPHANGFACRVVPKEYRLNPDEVINDLVLVKHDGSMQTLNPLQGDDT